MPSDSDTHAPVDGADRWHLPVGEGVVTQLQIDFAFGFTVEQWLHFRIEGPFVVESGPSDVAAYDPEVSGSVAPLVNLHQAVVTDAAVHKDGRLVVRFGDGRVLVASPGEQYEAFSVTGSWQEQEPFRLISLPGGGLAEWVHGDAPYTQKEGRLDVAGQTAASRPKQELRHQGGATMRRMASPVHATSTGASR